jgi:hypothetical protein
MSAKIKVAVVNYAGLSDHDVTSGIAALQAQVSDDLLRAWGVDAELFHLEKIEPRANVYGLILTRSKSQGAKSPPYPEATTHGLPLANVFLGDLADGQDWTHAASRELLNLLVEPIVSNLVYRQVGHDDGERHYVYVRDITAPCASYLHGYQQRGRRVADFVHPVWFSSSGHADVRSAFDQERRIRAPFGILEGERVYAYDLDRDEWLAIEVDPTTGVVNESKGEEPTHIRAQRLARFMKEHRTRVDEHKTDSSYPGGP